MIPFSDMDPRGQRFPVINIAIILTCIGVFVYEMLLSSQPFIGQAADACLQTLGHMQGGLSQLDRFTCTYSVIPTEIVRGQDLFTLVTSLFLHGGFLHLAGNMLYLWVFGDNIERGMGSFFYLLFYIAGGVIASLTQIFLGGLSSIPNLGASGAIAAVLGAYLVWFPRRQVRTLLFIGPFFTFTRISALIVLGFWFVLQIVSSFASLTPSAQTGAGGGVAYWAHVGGFVFGLLVGVALRGIPYVRQMRTTSQ